MTEIKRLLSRWLPRIISVFTTLASYASLGFVLVSLGYSTRRTCLPTFSPGAIEGYFSMQPSPCGYSLPENSQLLSLGVSSGCFPLVEDPDPNMIFTNMPCDLCAADKLTTNVKYYHDIEPPSLRYKYVPIEDPTEERKRICGLSKDLCDEAMDTISRVVSLAFYFIAGVLFTLVLKFEVLDNPRMTSLFKKSACLLGSLAFCNAAFFAFIMVTFATTLSSMNFLAAVVLLAVLQVINGWGLVLVWFSKKVRENQDIPTKRMMNLVIKFFTILGIHSSLEMLSYHFKHFESAETCNFGYVVDAFKFFLAMLAIAFVILDSKVKMLWSRAVADDVEPEPEFQELQNVQSDTKIKSQPDIQHQFLPRPQS